MPNAGPTSTATRSHSTAQTAAGLRQNGTHDQAQRAFLMVDFIAAWSPPDAREKRDGSRTAHCSRAGALWMIVTQPANSLGERIGVAPHFYRLFHALIQESPGTGTRRTASAGTRRLATRTHKNSHYWDCIRGELWLAGSIHASLPPGVSDFAESLSPNGATHIHLPAPSGFHFCAPDSRSEGALTYGPF